MSSHHPITILLYIFYTLSHITLSDGVQSTYDKTQFIIMYITSESSLPPNTFRNSFNTFNTSLQSVLHNTLPTISSSFNIPQTNLWCIPDNTNIYATFYMQINFNSDKNDINIISNIINRLNNDLLSEIILNKIQTINSTSPLLHPNPFTFKTLTITTTKNITFITNNEIDCQTYLIEIENKRSQTTATQINDIPIGSYINHDDDDIVQFFVYGIRIHWDVFLIWSIICVLIGITVCTAIFCLHIRIIETRRIKRKTKRKTQRMERRKHNSFLEQTPSCVTSTHISIDPSEDDDDIITIIRPNSAKTNVTEISETDTINYNNYNTNHNRTRSIQIKRRKKSKSYEKLKLHSVIENPKHKRNKSYSKIKKGSKYDSIPTHYFDDDELKQDELLHISNDNNMHLISRQISMEDELKTQNSRRNSTETLQTNNTENKIVTVHVHHHYNPNIEYKMDNISMNSPKNNEQIIEHKQHEYYPDLPYEKQKFYNRSPHYMPMNSPIIIQQQQQQQQDVNMNNILSVRNNNNNNNSISNKKELSKSQREGFSPITKQRSRHSSHSKKLKAVRKSIASQPDDHLSDSELMYAPGPAADSTPHTLGNTHTPFTQTPRDNGY